MKPTISKADWAALPAAIQNLYEENGDSYKIKAEFTSYTTARNNPDEDDPEEQIAKILGAKQHEKTLRKAAEDRATVAEAALQAIRDKEEAAKLKGIREGGDVAALEKSYKDKLAAAEAAAKEETARLNSALGEATVGRTAAAMAAEISTAPRLVEPLIRARLRPEITADGTVIERVLDAAGQPSAMTVAELKKEICGQEDLKGVIKGHIAKGGDVRPGGEKGGRSLIKLSDFKGKDGLVNWSKVSAKEQEEPGFLAQFKKALVEAKEKGEW
jgi:hypothetical protein